LGDDLALGAASFLKSDTGQDLGVLVCGYWLSVDTLRFLSDDLKAKLALFIADKNGNMGKAKHSTLVDKKGELISDVPLPAGLLDNFTQRLTQLREKARNAGEILDGRSMRGDFLQIDEVETGGLTYDTAYQGLLTDDGDFLGILAIARDVTAAVAQQHEVMARAGKAVQNAETMETQREEIARGSNKVQKDAQNLVMTTVQAKEKLENTLGTVEGVSRTARMSTFVALLVALCIGAFIAFLVNRLISRPIKRVIEGLTKSTDEVSAGSGMVSSCSQSLADGASEQASSIEETSASLEEMASMTKQNAGNAIQADDLMKEANQVVSKANESMTQLTTSMEEISKASEETSKIIKTIDEIAFQTNLLALNAAVEAARAGEAGAGFAVVADEVRNLAMRAADAAKDTATLIEGTVKKVNDGSDLVARTNDAFVQVAESSSKVGNLVAEIAAASNEQAQGIEQVNRAVSEMDRVTQKTAANAEESASASEQMNAQAEQMKGMVNELVSLVGGVANTYGKAGKEKSLMKEQVAGGIKPLARPASEKNAKGKKLAIHNAKSEIRRFSGEEVDPDQIIPLSGDDFKDF
jgi:methyl-accepting chemotaxis protein